MNMTSEKIARIYDGMAVLEKEARRAARESGGNRAKTLDLCLTALLAVLNVIIMNLDE